MVFVNAEIVFEKVADPAANMSIMSSYRTNNWIIAQDEDEMVIQDLVDRILAAFASSVFEDTEDILLKTGKRTAETYKQQTRPYT